MTDTQHTPTPWVQDGFKIRAINNTNDTNGRCIAETRVQHNIPLSRPSSSFARQSAQNLDNAAHIVKCVNMHEELVEIIKQYRCEIKRRQLEHDGHLYTIDYIATETLKKAGAL